MVGMTEVFQIVVAILQVLFLIVLVGGGVVLYFRHHAMSKLIRDAQDRSEELKTTLAAMNKFHNDNIERQKTIDALMKQHTQQISALVQAQSAHKPSFVR
jgi:hypothetical protein